MEALFDAIKKKDIGKVNDIVATLPSEEIEFDSLTSDGVYTALMVACEFSNLEIIKVLLAKKALVSYEIGYCDNTVLKSLARGVNSDLEILNVLIESLDEKYMPHEVTNCGNEDADEAFLVDGESSLTPIELAEKHGKTEYLIKFKEYL